MTILYSWWNYILPTDGHYIEICLIFHAQLPGGALPLWESVGMRRGFAPHFRHLDDLFALQNLTMSAILFRSCWVPFWKPPIFSM